MVISRPSPLASLTELAQELPKIWKQVRPDDVLEVTTMAAAADITEQAMSLPGAQIRPLAARSLSGENFDTAIISHLDRWVADGNSLLNTDPLQVETADSGAVGELIDHAQKAGVKEIVIRLGDSFNHDAGLGLLRAVSGHRGALSLGELPEVLDIARKNLNGIGILVAADYDVTFTGLDGAGADLVERGGLDPAAAQDLEQRLMPYVREVEHWYKGRQLMASGAGAYPFTRAPLGGAGGGVAAMLVALGARIQTTGAVSAQLAQIQSRVPGCDLAVIIVDQLDGIAIGDGVVGQVTQSLGEAITPVVVIARQAYASPRQYAQAGVHAVYEIEDLHSLNQPEDRVMEVLLERIQRVARNWSRSG